MSETYNGWTNYETWLYSLWNDGRFSEDAISELDNSEPKYDWETKKDRAISNLEEFMKDDLDEMVEELGLSGMFSDLMSAAVDSIDFRKVAKSEIDDVYDEWLSNNPKDTEKEF